MHAVGQQSTVETLFITVAQRNNGTDQRFLWGPFPGYITDGSNSCCRVSDVDNSSYELVFGPSSSLQRRVAELQANGSCDIGRQATSEDTV
jgi:hypothetical protein